MVHATGGLYDTIRPLDVEHSTGNGFRFDHYGSGGLPLGDRPGHGVSRAAARKSASAKSAASWWRAPDEFSHKEVARRYIEIYEEMLERPLVEKESGEAIKAIAESLAGGQ